MYASARAAALAVVCAACGGNSGQNDETSSQGGVILKRAFPKLTFDAPIAIVQPPGDSSYWYVVERLGTIKRFDATDEITDTATPVLNLQVDASGEGGLLSFAFHPDLPLTDRRFCLTLLLVRIAIRCSSRASRARQVMTAAPASIPRAKKSS
jgi:hypothetical protein